MHIPSIRTIAPYVALAMLVAILALTPLAHAQADPCTEDIAGNTTISGDLADNCVSGNREGSYARFYTLNIDTQAQVTVTLESVVDPYLFLFQGGDKDGPIVAENDDHEESRVVSQVVADLSPGTYTIEVTTYGPGESGSFTLTVSSIPDDGGSSGGSAPTDPCAENIASNTRVGGVLAGGCASTNKDGSNARFYFFNLDSASDVTITMESTDFDTYLYLLEGNTKGGSVVAENDDHEGSTAMSLITASLGPGAYTVEATSYEAGGVGNFTLTVSDRPGDSQAAPILTPPDTIPAAPESSGSLSEVIDRVRPSVVKIHHDRGQGSGVIVRAEGQTAWAITNEHVVSNQLDVVVTVGDTREVPGTVVGADQQRDLAVVSFLCFQCAAASFGDSRALNVGDRVFAIGYPFDSAQPRVVEPPDRVIVPGAASVTQGTVSAFRYDSVIDVEYIQSDTAINGGNSGGPLLSADGQVIGINTFGLRDSYGLEYAILETTIQEHLPGLMSGNLSPVVEPLEPGYDIARLVGPLSGHLHHDPAGIDLVDVGVYTENPVVAVTFKNPYSGSVYPFSYGLVLRFGPDGGLYFALDSQGRWIITERFFDGTPPQTVAEGPAGILNTRNRSANQLTAYLVGGTALFELNGVLLTDDNGRSSIDVALGAGSVYVMNGFYANTSRAGAITHFEGLVVSELYLYNVSNDSGLAEEVFRAWPDANTNPPDWQMEQPRPSP